MSFLKSLERELGKNTGKLLSNLVFGDGHSTPYRLVASSKERQEKKRNQRLEEIQFKLDRLEAKQIEKEEKISINIKTVKEEEAKLAELKNIHLDYVDFVDWDDIEHKVIPFLENPVNLVPSMREQLDHSIKDQLRMLRTELNLEPKHFNASSVSLLFNPRLKSKIKRFKKLEENLYGSQNAALHDLKDKYRMEYDEYLDDRKEILALKEINQGIQKNDPNSYMAAMKLFNPTRELMKFLKQYSLILQTDNQHHAIELTMKEDDVVPKTKIELTRTGQSIRRVALGKSEFNQLYQDIICSCILRASKDCLQILPLTHIIVDVKQNQISTSTGQEESICILSVTIDRDTLENLNFSRIDPSDALSNFEHNMNFKKLKGFNPVQKIANHLRDK